MIRGFILGLAIAAPVGPIGILCIRRTLIHGRASGICTGLGAATADALYGLIAVLGLSAIAQRLASADHALKLAGGLLLCILGVRAFLDKTAPGVGAPGGSEIGNPIHYNLRAAFADFGSTFLLTLTNPLTILSFSAVIAGGMGELLENVTRWGWVLVFGIFLGSTSWWVFLSGLISALQLRFIQPLWVIRISRISGAVLFVFGVGAVAASLKGGFYE